MSYLKIKMLKLRCLCWLKVQTVSLLRYNASTFSCFLHLSDSLSHILSLQTVCMVLFWKIYIDGYFVYYAAC